MMDQLSAQLKVIAAQSGSSNTPSSQGGSSSSRKIRAASGSNAPAVVPPAASATAASAAASTTVADSPPLVIPAQIQSGTAELAFTRDYSSFESMLSAGASAGPEGGGGGGGASSKRGAGLARMDRAAMSLAVRRLMPMLPACTARGSLDFRQVTRQVKAAVDNSIFIYPTQCERFKFR